MGPVFHKLLQLNVGHPELPRLLDRYNNTRGPGGNSHAFIGHRCYGVGLDHVPDPKGREGCEQCEHDGQRLAFKAPFRTYMGPPAMVPSLFVVRYLTDKRASAYLVEIPKTPVSHIHKTAPGPPAATAVATPTMLPVPIVAAKAVVRAANGLTSPLPLRHVTDSLMALPMKR